MFSSFFRLTRVLGAVALLLMLSTVYAHAVDLFGVSLIGEQNAVPEGALAYTAAIEIDGEDRSLKDKLSQISLLVTNAKQGAADTGALAARAQADIEQLTAALYAEAHYGAKIDVRIAGIPLGTFNPDAIEATPSAPIVVQISIAPGPVFHFGQVAFTQTAPTRAQPPTEPEFYKLVRGAPARSDIIITAIDRFVEEWRRAGYPFARVAQKDIRADHARSMVDLHVAVDPGAPAVYGWISVVGTKDMSSDTIADQSALRPGQRFDPKDLKTTRERLRKLEAVESVRIVEGENVDASGGIPITLDVTERKPRFFGATAFVSTLDGAEVGAFWGHRNLFGEGERLRVDGSVSRLGADSIDQLQYNAGAVFSKPGILDIDTDLFLEFRFEREAPDTYDSYSGRIKGGLSRRFDDHLSGTIALEGRQAYVEDAFGDRDFTLISLPTEIDYDTRDNKLDPASGVHIFLRGAPTVDVAGGNAFVESRAQLASYLALTEERRAILAGRVVVGSVAGASLIDVPATSRFFAGGGGSARGYEYRSLGPEYRGEVTGGLALAEASAELRLRVTETIGLVPFIDVAAVSSESTFDFSDPLYVGAGIGLRYFSAIGPIRLDAAVPLTERDDRPGFGLYVGLGQAF
ncbi:autotransporter secretion outer membrane protein TamA [Filomicrobium insigne]|uniref:Autotransporter secretion outer membrane protein TamA n=2 Tax=Filomicrobium insigne TaxID=418854 RepID=A0A1H0GT69_9HYPH|nr:autotransporter secretion outer membrane protein TamA [Filomicrobium insigne]